MSLTAVWSQAAENIVAGMSTPLGVLAVVSAGIAMTLGLVSSFVKTMIPLRWLAVGGNLGFMLYGALYPSMIMLVLHGLLLPINVVRALGMIRLTQRVIAARRADDLSGVWLKPYMRSRRCEAGEVLFRKGDPATHLYFLDDGLIELMEIGTALEPGRLFGEMAFFAPDRRRTLTARCASDCTVMTIDESAFEQLYFQHPAFGVQIVTLVAGRLISDMDRLKAQVAARMQAQELSIA